MRDDGTTRVTPLQRAGTGARPGGREHAAWLWESAVESSIVGRWFLRDFFLRYRWGIGWVTLLGSISAALQGGSILVLHRAFQTQATDGMMVVPVLGWTLTPELFAAAVATVVVGAIGGAALLSMLAVRRILRLKRRYQLYAANALLSAIERATARGALDARTVRMSQIRAALQGVARLGSLARVGANSLLPVCRFVSFSATAAILDPMLTAALLPAVVVVGGVSSLVFGRRAARSLRSASQMARSAREDLETRIAAASRGEAYAFEEDAGAEPSPFVRRTDFIDHRFLRVEENKLWITMLTLFVVAALIVGAGFGGLTDPQYRGSLVIYLTALVLALRQLIAIGASLSGFSRFLPGLQRHIWMLDCIETIRSPEHFCRRVASRDATASAEDQDDEETI